MFCNRCGCNEAVVHYSPIENGELMELHLCELCAEQEGLGHQPKFSVSYFLKESHAPITCPHCGLSYELFSERGRLGCCQCYDVFSHFLDDLLKTVHGRSVHEGKCPENSIQITQNKKLERLKKELKRVIKVEQYEVAAQLRDEIRSLESSNESE